MEPPERKEKDRDDEFILAPLLVRTVMVSTSMALPERLREGAFLVSCFLLGFSGGFRGPVEGRISGEVEDVNERTGQKHVFEQAGHAARQAALDSETAGRHVGFGAQLYRPLRERGKQAELGRRVQAGDGPGLLDKRARGPREYHGTGKSGRKASYGITSKASQSDAP